jgi:hypothetical protein
MFGSEAFLAAALVGLVVGALCFLRSLVKFESGLLFLVIAVLFGGIVSINFGSGAFAILFRDTFIVLPLYLGFFFGRAGQNALASLPADLVLVLFFLLCVMMMCVFVPTQGSVFQILIGAKVWLFYIPFAVVGIAIAGEPALLRSFLRQILLLGFAACAIGLLQSLLVRVFGFETVMGWFFGRGAAQVTQGFAFFDMVGGVYRIPGTFSFAAQYAAFLYLYITVAMIASNTDPHPQIRTIARVAIFMAVVAGVLSGQRAAILVFPAIISAYALCGLLNVRFFLLAPIGIGAAIAAFAYSGIEPVAYFFWGIDLAEQNRGFLWDQVSEALSGSSILGAGIGASTGAARYAIASSWAGQADPTLKFESYFAKAAAELGVFGLVAITAILALVLLRALNLLLRYRRTDLNLVVAPLVVYLAINIVSSFKGWPLDTDPGNIFFWLCLGLLIGADRVGRFGQVDNLVGLDVDPNFAEVEEEAV